MAVTVRQKAFVDFNGVSSVNLTLPAAGANPSRYVAVLMSGTGGIGSTPVSDSINGSYTKDAGDQPYAAIYSKANASTGAPTFTATLSGTATGTFAVFELISSGGAPTLDAAGGFNADVTTVAANCWAVNGMFPGVLPTDGWTEEHRYDAAFVIHYTQTIADTGAAGTFVNTDGSNSYAVATYAPVAGGGGGPTTFQQSVGGSITGSGSLARLTKKLLAGNTAAAGAIVRKTSTRKTGSMTASGGVTSRAVIRKLLNGSITVAGAIKRKCKKLAAGSIAAAGSITRKTKARRTGSIAPSGALTEKFTFRKALAGSITAAGAVARQFKAFVASLTAFITSARRRGRR